MCSTSLFSTGRVKPAPDLGPLAGQQLSEPHHLGDRTIHISFNSHPFPCLRSERTTLVPDFDRLSQLVRVERTHPSVFWLRTRTLSSGFILPKSKTVNKEEGIFRGSKVWKTTNRVYPTIFVS